MTTGWPALTLTVPLRGLSAGTHTVIPEVYWTSTGTVYSSGSGIGLMRFRGGLVPVRKDGTSILDKPAAWDFIGPNVQVTNVGGTAKVNFNGVAEGVDVTTAELTSNVAINAVDPSFDDITGLSVTVDAVEGERVMMVFWGGLVANSIASTGRLRWVVNGTPTDSWMCTGQWGWQLPFSSSRMSPPLQAGSNTIKLQGSRDSYAMSVQGTDPYQSRIEIIRFKGGYTQPENLPILRYSSASVVGAYAQPGRSPALSVALNDSQRYSAVSPLTVDLSASGLGGLDTGSEAADTWYYVYAVPGATSGTFELMASVTDPATGPTGYPVFRYLGFVRNDSSSNIKPFDYREVGVYRYRDPSDTEAVIYWAEVASPTTGVWNNIDLSTAAPVAVTGAVTLEGVLDSDSGVQQFHIEPGNPPAFTPGTGWNTGRATNFLTGQDSCEESNTRTYPLFDGTLSYMWVQRNNSIDLGVFLREVHDKYLTNVGGSQTQAPTLADTKLPKLTYTAAGQITVAPSPGEPSTVRQALQDGKQRYVLSSLLFDFANGVADLGLDEGTEQASTWYYMYLVPTTGLDDLLTVRASDNPPDTGPTGYSNFKYLGAFYNDSSADIVNFRQVSGDRFEYIGRFNINSSTTITGPYAIDCSATIPITANLGFFAVGAHQFGTGYNSVVLYTSEGGSSSGLTRINVAVNECNADVCGSIPMDSDQQIFRTNTSNDGGVLGGGSVYVMGWADAYLAGDRGGGGQAVAATGGGGGGTTVDSTETVTPAGGGVTSLALTNTPVSATTVKLWQDGVLMRRVTGTPSGLNEWYYNSGLNQAEFNDTLSSTWYYLEWEK